jgi:hypothetical protein
VLAPQKQSAPGKRHKGMFSAEHFIFILFPEIKQFRGSENMCFLPRDKFLLPATKHVLAPQKQSAPGKRHKGMFSTEHFIFILFPEIKQFRGSENMCLRRFKNP